MPTKIEWTDESWNPIRARNRATGKTGHFCVHVSPGCKHCYAERMQPFLGNPVRYAAQDRGKVDLFLDEKELLKPLRWRRPRMVFPCSMTDLFGEFVPDEWIDRIFTVMALTPHHIYQPLTKRPERMREYMNSLTWPHHRVWRLDPAISQLAEQHHPDPDAVHFDPPAWPLPNVWLGTSVEDQQRADERIPLLLDTPAALRWVSYEPALGPVDFENIIYPKLRQRDEFDPYIAYDVLRGHMKGPDDIGLPKLDWIVCGGESGRDARPFDIEWARSTLAQCRAAGTAFYLKQLGARPVAPQTAHGITVGSMDFNLTDKKGGDPEEWPADLRVREFPEVVL